MRGLVTALLTALVLFCLAGYQVTSETAATRFLGRLGASLIEIDRWLPVHREDIQLVAQDKPQSLIEVRDLPIRVEIPASQALALDEAGLKTALVEIMGDTLYHNGTDAFQDSEGEQRSLSAGEPVRWTVSLLSPSMHSFWRLALFASFAGLALFTVTALLSRRSPLRAILVGVVFAALASTVVWFLTQLATGVFTSTVDREIVAIVRDGAWLGMRNSLAIGALVATLAFVLSVIKTRRNEAPAYEPTPRYDDGTHNTYDRHDSDYSEQRYEASPAGSYAEPTYAEPVYEERPAYEPEPEQPPQPQAPPRPPLPEGVPDWLRR